MTNVINRTVKFATTVATSDTTPTPHLHMVLPPPPQQQQPQPQRSSSEYVAVILAGSVGTRLYPVTNDDDEENYIPKHMLPVCGIPLLLRLLNSIELCGFAECVLLLKNDDTATMDLFLKPTLLYTHPYQIVQHNEPEPLSKESSSVTMATGKDIATTNEFESSTATTTATTTTTTTSVKVTVVQSTQMKVTILQYDTPCLGTVDALRRISETTTTTTTTILRPTSHMVVFPSDLFVLDTTPIRNMIHEHRCHGYHRRYHSSDVATSDTAPSSHSDVPHDFTATTTTTTAAGRVNPVPHSQAFPPAPATGQSLTLSKTSTATTPATTNSNIGTLLPSTVAGTVLLMDVTAIDESTLQPIYKESAKQKKGLLSREDDDVFYMAIQSTTCSRATAKFGANEDSTTTHRLIWKQSKFDVEEDKEQIGTTPKVKLPKFRLYGGITTKNTSNSTNTTATRLSTEWNDVHCYLISSWVLQQLCISEKLQSARYQSIQYDLIPLLISRQYRGITATFCNSDSNNATVSNNSNANTSALSSSTSLTMPADSDQRIKYMNPTMPSAQMEDQSLTHQPSTQDNEYMVLTHVSNSRTPASTTPSIFRSNTIASYLFANRVMAHELSAMNVSSLQQQPQQSPIAANTNALLSIPTGTTIQSKFHTILLPECNIGEKVTFKSCVIGRHCTIGNNCRLNNVVLHDHVTIGDNTTLQSSIVSAHVTIGSNCNFNDCQILHHMNIPSNTKKKGEAITSIDE